MAHDPSKVLMGATTSSEKEVSKHSGSPSTLIAGLALRQKSDGTLSVLKADGQLLGLSLGKALSDDTKCVSVCRSGLGVPILLEATPARGTIEIDGFANLLTDADTIEVAGVVFTAVASSPTATQFEAATSDEATATSLATQINANPTSGALVIAVAEGAVVTVTAKVNTTAGNAYTLVYTDNGNPSPNAGATVSGSGTLEGGGSASDFVEVGSKVYVSDTTGKADDPNSLATITDAVYRSGVLTGIQEDGTEAAVALIDFPGGL